jgi:hypothetical protein
MGEPLVEESCFPKGNMEKYRWLKRGDKSFADPMA